MTTHVNINRHKDIAKAASTSASVGSFFRPQIQRHYVDLRSGMNPIGTFTKEMWSSCKRTVLLDGPLAESPRCIIIFIIDLSFTVYL